MLFPPEIDKCNPNPCQHQGSCTEIIGGTGYACKCAYGYKGKDCERKIHLWIIEEIKTITCFTPRGAVLHYTPIREHKNINLI